MTDPEETEDENVERGRRNLARIAAEYLHDVIEAVEESPEAEQRRPVMLALKLGVSFTAAVVDVADLLPSFLPDEPEGDDDNADA